MLATTTTDMPLYIKIGGVDCSAICAHAEPHESVAVLLERIEEALAFVSMPTQSSRQLTRYCTVARLVSEAAIPTTSAS
jgi:hypothetical protein